MQVKTLATTTILVVAAAIAPAISTAQSGPSSQGSAVPQMYGTITGPSSANLGANIVIDVMGKDQDTVYTPGYVYIDPETGQPVEVPERFDVVDSYNHNASEIVLDEEGFGLGTLVDWSLQQEEPGGVRRFQTAVKVTSVMTASGFGKIIITYDDTAHPASVFHDSSITLSKTIGLVQP